MRYLLVAINAKYIHSNPAIYSLKEYAIDNIPSNLNYELIIGEYTINNQIDDILTDIYEKQPDVIAFSCYIWNISYVDLLISEIKKVLPKVKIWCGGPEVSYRASSFISSHLPNVDLVMLGEGEVTLSELIKANESGIDDYSSIQGIAYLDDKVEVSENSPRTDFNFNTVPFIYRNTPVSDLANRIIYYESSRGCPFSCSYCLSSIDKCIRFRDLDKVLNELQYFLDNQVPQVKFIDRTFNCNPDRATSIWKYIYEHDNGITNFHFEIAADLLNQEQVNLIKNFRPGLIQLEVGVQSTNQSTLKEINRHCDMDKLSKNVAAIKECKNTHQHLDLIAGLPFEDLTIFINSFNDVYNMLPDQLQLGFLKVLSGSYMKEHVEDYQIEYRHYPPYEILSSKWLSFSDILELKRVETVLEIYYNSHQFENSISLLEKCFDTPYSLYHSLGEYYNKCFDTTKKHSRISRYDMLLDFYNDYCMDNNKDCNELYDYTLLAVDNDDNSCAIDLKLSFADMLMLDIYERENIKTRPGFANDISEYKKDITKLKQKYNLSNKEHIEVLVCNNEPVFILFDYDNRNPLNYSAKKIVLA